jgi:hypothetical protein
MRDIDARIYQDILMRMTARFLAVRPGGIEVRSGGPLVAQLHARILNHGAARTLYRQRQPVCRSLDGVKALDDPNKVCAACPALRECTAQVRLDLLVESAPYRLLLAFTSAKNFLLYRTLIGQDELVNCITTIREVDRGSWGELRFARQRPAHEPPSR